MLNDKVPWNLRTVLSIHLLRLLVGLLLVRILYPLIVEVTPFVVEVTDRIVVLVLVWLAVRRYKGDFRTLGLTFQNFKINLLYGIFVGFLLLVISIYSEKIYTTVLFLTPSQHPLVAQAEKAISWYDLASPLFLADGRSIISIIHLFAYERKMGILERSHCQFLCFCPYAF